MGAGAKQNSVTDTLPKGWCCVVFYNTGKFSGVLYMLSEHFMRVLCYPTQGRQLENRIYIYTFRHKTDMIQNCLTAWGGYDATTEIIVVLEKVRWYKHPHILFHAP